MIWVVPTGSEFVVYRALPAFTGTVAINNFDGHNFNGTVSGASGFYVGAISGGGTNRTGSVLGQFYGPAAAETGGTFAVQATSGPSYTASGIFAGKR